MEINKMELKISSQDLETIAILHDSIPKNERKNIVVQVDGSEHKYESWEQIKDLHKQYGHVGFEYSR